MTTYVANLIGEDNTEFTREVEAANKKAALQHIDNLWPEARIIGVYSPSDIRQIENARYRRLCAAYDSDCYYE